LVQNIKRDPFEQAGRPEPEDGAFPGRLLAGPVTGYIYD